MEANMDEAPEEQFEDTSIGGQLRRAREARGLSLDDVASQTRIPVRHLQHVEQEEWDALPAVTYCIGFVRAYANMVGLDGAELSRQLRDRIGGTRTRAPAPDYYEPADPARVPPRSLAVIAAVIAVVLIAGYAIWRSTLGGPDDPIPGVPPAEQAAPGGQQQAPAQPAPAAPVAGQPVVLTATGEVWLRISDGGASLFEGILMPGQTYQVPPQAQAPMLRTGRPQMLRVGIGGRDLGLLEPVERTVDNVSLRAEDLARRGAAATTALPLAPQPPAG